MQTAPERPTYTLAELVPALDGVSAAAMAVAGVAVDSRLVQPGDLFFARSGNRFDAASVARDAVRRGAAAIVIPTNEELHGLGVPVLKVGDFRVSLGYAAAVSAGWPSRRLQLFGVTGTNGKTTVSELVARSLDQRAPCGLIGTLGTGYPGALGGGLHTTPDIVAIQHQLAGFLDDGAEAAVMEVSSHGLDQGRTEGLEFFAAAFTNLTRDHLDYHGSMSAYGATKARLFRDYGAQALVINCDDAFGRTLVDEHAHTGRVTGYSLRPDEARASLVATNLTDSGAGLRLDVQGEFGVARIASRLIGQFNAHNLLAAFGLLLASGMPADEAAAKLGAAPPADGRMQWLGGDGLPRVVVDYAHTPDALRAALEALRPSVAGNLWVVFGCGGDRDPGKRPEMAAIAERNADRVIVTDDNPRTEASASIIEDIMTGFASPRCVVVRADRATAIHEAILWAAPEDTVLLAGKGHETYQERNGERREFDDRAHARAALDLRASGSVHATEGQQP